MRTLRLGLSRLALSLGLLVVACNTPGGTASPSPSGVPAGAPTTVTGLVTAGPVCPVERNPPDPSCAPRMLASAVIVATDTDGREVARTATAPDGSYLLTIGQTGTFTITAQPVAGLMRAPAPATVTLAFPGATERIDLTYDTGIR